MSADFLLGFTEVIDADAKAGDTPTKDVPNTFDRK
jgi:hypothetical protein